jgi:uncharacterized damage-inducible protein DinB
MMSPSHRAEVPRAAEPPAPSDPDELDFLVDRLAQEQADQATAREVAEDAAVDRPRAPLVGGEIETLHGTLEELRASIRWKVEGLGDEQASRRLVGSDTTVIGMLQHLADTERYWFRAILGAYPAEEVGYRWSQDHDAEAEWSLALDASLSRACEDYEDAIAASRAQLLGRDPEEELRAGPEVRTVRWVLAHMIAETARHAGQLDILTEQIDGRTGE